PGSPAPYPSHWEADIIARDGEMFHIRPVRPSDAGGLQALHLAQSEGSRIFRFFAPRGELSDAELARFTEVDHVSRVALVVTDSSREEELLAFGTYDAVDSGSAEVAFYVADSAHGRGLGSILLDHLAAAAWERGLHRFEADVLPTNARMLAVFRDAGYTLASQFDDGVITVSFDIAPTEESRRVLAAREQHSESLSMAGVLAPARVVGVGGGALLPRGIEAWDGSPLPPLTLALIDDDVPALRRHLASLGAAGAHAAVVLTRVDEAGAWYRELLRTARDADVRLVGPSSLGVVTVGGANLTAEPGLQGGGEISVVAHRRRSFSEIADRFVAAGVPLRSFVAAGNRLDVSGNDAMQWWISDPGTKVAAIALDSIGNPRKFARISRELARRMPVVCHIGSTTGQLAPPSHPVRTSALPRGVLSGMLRQSGVIEAESRADLVDLARLAVSGRPSGVALVATTESGWDAGRQALRTATLPFSNNKSGYDPYSLPKATYCSGEVVIVVDQPLAGEVRHGSAAEVAAGYGGGVIAVVRHPAPVRLEGTSAVVTDDLGRAVRLAKALIAGPTEDSAADAYRADHGAARAVLARAEAAEFGPQEVDALLAAYGLELEAETGPGRGETDGWEDLVIEGTEDPLYGPVIGFHHAGDAEWFGDVAYRIAPLTQQDVEGLVGEPRSSVRLESMDLAPLHGVIARIAQLKDDLPEVARIRGRVRARDGEVRLIAAEVHRAGAGRLDTRGRAMPGGDFQWDAPSALDPSAPDAGGPDPAAPDAPGAAE
ncbi:MAG: GNAT family N-acetyltransferase, partial [bacterium]|nr:GNAT family N-acetyltransferase [bacterium]